ncbi:MAG: hypothetical protein JO287_05385 [Pseudonocardiales bacterium]|nr:hypothetical protein [Pseudonocardiales bacterium]
MKRLVRVAIPVMVALGALAPVVPSLAQADSIGGVVIIPGTGTDLSPIRLRTSTGCPTQASKYYATMRGHDFPPSGQIITSTTEAGLSTSAGFDVYVEQIMRDYAAQNHTTLAGRYDITVHCTDSLALESYGEFTGSLEFTSPTTYQAIGTAKPPPSPPPPFPKMGDDPVLKQGSASSLTAPIRAPGQLAAKRNNMTGQGASRLPVALVSVALVAVVAGALASHSRKRRAS